MPVVHPENCPHGNVLRESLGLDEMEDEDARQKSTDRTYRQHEEKVKTLDNGVVIKTMVPIEVGKKTNIGAVKKTVEDSKDGKVDEDYAQGNRKESQTEATTHVERKIERNSRIRENNKYSTAQPRLSSRNSIGRK